MHNGEKMMEVWDCCERREKLKQERDEHIEELEEFLSKHAPGFDPDELRGLPLSIVWTGDIEDLFDTGSDYILPSQWRDPAGTETFRSFG